MSAYFDKVIPQGNLEVYKSALLFVVNKYFFLIMGIDAISNKLISSQYFVQLNHDVLLKE